MGTGVLFRGGGVGKAAERVEDHATPNMAGVKNEWSYTSTPLYAFMEWTEITLHFQLIKFENKEK
jgi:hypothetical protein